jgi:L-threonylcarbamoyladenylate synthase
VAAAARLRPLDSPTSGDRDAVTNPAPITRSVSKAAAALRAGRLVAIPTETVYGLAACADDEQAVRQLFVAKQRPASSPLIVHLADADGLAGWAVDLPAAAWRLAEVFWPGPLTLVVQSNGRAAAAVVAHRSTVAVRVTAHAVARAVIRAVGTGLAAPSANRHGALSPTTARHVSDAFDAEVVAFVLDGGACRIGIESTIVDVTAATPRILRPGAISRADLERVGVDVADGVVALRHDQIAGAAVAAPGQSRSHYAPRARVVVCDSVAQAVSAANEAAVSLPVGVIAAADAATLRAAGLRPGVLLLAAEPDAGRLAHRLYAALHEADRHGIGLVVTLPPRVGAAADAIHDRLVRAAAPRDRGEPPAGA